MANQVSLQTFAEANAFLVQTQRENIINELQASGLAISPASTNAEVLQSLLGLYFTNRDLYTSIVNKYRIDVSKLSAADQARAIVALEKFKGPIPANAKCDWYILLGCSESQTVVTPTTTTTAPAIGTTGLIIIAVLAIAAIIGVTYFITK